MRFLDLTGLSHFLDKLKSLKGADNGFAGLDKNGFVEEDQLLYRSKEVIYFTKQVSSTTMASVGTSLINPKQVVYDKSKNDLLPLMHQYLYTQVVKLLGLRHQKKHIRPLHLLAARMAQTESPLKQESYIMMKN